MIMLDSLCIFHFTLPENGDVRFYFLEKINSFRASLRNRFAPTGPSLTLDKLFLMTKNSYYRLLFVLE